MTVTFVPPRTLIHGAGSIPPSGISSVHAGGDVEMGDQDEDVDIDIDMEEAEEHGGGRLLAKKLVVPGQLVTDDPQFMRYVNLHNSPWCMY